MKKLVTLMVVAIAACCFFTSCDKEDGGRIKKSDILGTWYEGFPDNEHWRYEFNKDGTYDCYYTYRPSGYNNHHIDNGKYEIYPKERLFVKYGYGTYDILILNETTFNFISQNSH